MARDKQRRQCLQFGRVPFLLAPTMGVETMVKLTDTVYGDGRKQGDIAKAAGITASTLSRILNGHSRPQQRSICRLAAALGVGADSLIGSTRQKKGGAKCK